jgi:large subunit ribosomal protein L9
VQAQRGVELDRRKLELAEALKELGTTEVQVRLHPDVVATLTVEVVAE